MLRHLIRLARPHETVSALARFRRALDGAALPPATAALLAGQVEEALAQFREQMSAPHTRRMSADRVFEGDGYRVAIEVRQGAGGLVSTLLRLLRGG